MTFPTVIQRKYAQIETFANASEPQVHLHLWIHTLRAGFGFIQKKTCNFEEKALNINCINEQLCKKY